jgi:hypothetical protein
MEINRSYDHRGGKTKTPFGHIGDVKFETPKGKYLLNGHELPESSIAHLMDFALQTLQDAYAGSLSRDEALGDFNKKLDKILNGTLGTRSGGDGADERTRVMRSVVHLAAKARFGSKSAEWATFTGLDDEARNAKYESWYEANKAAFDPSIDEEMERRAAKRTANATLAKAVTFEM